ncbi:MAG: PQQ-binding-like beta-propeller repeat protein, partial [Thermoplasmata archaeon]|nr:PQQ-binding-like beta-propeller repeat protein [Thermoplasmata archaeon]
MANLTKLIIVIVMISLISTQFFNVNECAAEITVTTSGMESPTERTARTDTWNMFSHDVQHTSNTTTTAPLTNNILWTNTTGTASESYSSPIIGYGKVFVGTGSSYFYCFDENTGEKLWANYYQKVSWGACGSATAVNGKIFVGAEDSYVYCLDPTDGSEVWKYKTNNAVWSCPAVVNNRVYIGSADRYLYCIDENSGNLVWKYETNHSTYGYQDYGISSSPAISNGKVFIAACDGNLTCLPLDDPNSDGIINTSEKYWEFDTGCYVYASPTVYNGKVYIGTGSYSKLAGAPPVYKLYCVDENSGAKLWEFTAGSYFLGTPAIGYDKLYIGSLDGRLYCLPLEDPNANGVISASEIIWQFNTGNELWGSAALAEERVYFASGVPYWESGNGDYRVYCLPINDPNNNGIIASNEIIWDYKIDAGVLCTPALLDGRLYVCDYDGEVYCFGKDTTPPLVKSVLPVEDATDAAIDTDIYVEFNENIAASTLTQSNFKVESEDSILVSGVITYDDILFTAKFDPDVDLDEATTYTVTLTNDIQDSNGNKLDCNGNGIIDPGEKYSWAFTTAKYPPEISNIPVQRPVEGEDWNLDMSLYVSDPNTPFNELIFTENSSYAEVQGELIVFNYPNGITNEQVNVSVTDGISTVWQLVRVEIKQTNDAPVIEPIPDIHAVEDIDKVVDISTYVSDIDNELDELTVADNSVYATVSGMVLTFNYPNGILSEIVNITVNDGNKQAHREVKVIVTPVNDAPYISEIPDNSAKEDEDLVVNITKYISDIDNTIDELTVHTNSDYASVESNANSIELTFNYPDGILYELVTVTASDSDKDASRGVNITIEPVNDPPTIGVIPVQYAFEDIDYELDLSEYVDDVDTPLG